MHEVNDTALECRALEKDMAAAGLAPDADVGAEAVDEPRVAPAGVGATEADEVAEVQLDDGIA